MNGWLMAFYHAHPLITVLVIFNIGYFIGWRAKAEGRNYWS